MKRSITRTPFSPKPDLSAERRNRDEAIVNELWNSVNAFASGRRYTGMEGLLNLQYQQAKEADVAATRKKHNRVAEVSGAILRTLVAIGEPLTRSELREWVQTELEVQADELNAVLNYLVEDTGNVVKTPTGKATAVFSASSAATELYSE